MPVQPKAAAVRPQTTNISPMSSEAIGAQWLYNSGLSGIVSAVWPSANLAIGYPFSVLNPSTALQMWCFNGATAAGNLDMGIYNDDGTKLVTKGSTAQAGTSDIQLLNITDTALAPGTRYWAVLGSDSATATFFRQTGSLNIGQIKATGVRCMAGGMSAGALISTLTWATLSSNYLPDFGVVLASDF